MGLADTGEFHIWNARNETDAARWREAYDALPRREVFAHPAYVRLFAGERDEPLVACLRTRDALVLYPFVLRTVDAPHLATGGPVVRDVISPYGYGGAFHHGATEVVAKEFWTAFDRYCRGRRVVSEFTRLSLFEDDRLPPPGPVAQRLTNVVRDLRPPLAEIWREVDHKVRKNVQKARRGGVTVEVDPHGDRLEDFLRVYYGTMDRRAAGAGYYFPRSFFRALIDELPGQLVFLHARHDGRVVSTELVLVSVGAVYSFLGGTAPEAFALRPNDLLKWQIIEWAQAQGKEHFVLGGGYAPDDGIFRYKRAFAPRGLVPFRVASRVHDEDAYHALVEAHLAQGHRTDPEWRLDPHFFPEYRQALPAGARDPR